MIDTTTEIIKSLDLTNTRIWYLAVCIFFVSYYFITTEEKYHLDKSKPALFSWTSIFIFTGIYFLWNWLDTNLIHLETSKLIVEISEIFFFLLVAMTFINVMANRWVFEVLRRNLISRWYSYKQLFWILWFITFFVSPIADNLTTALIMSTVASAVSKEYKFLIPTAITIVIAANAWWVWSPFWDITTLMAWTWWKWNFFDFLLLFPSAFIWWLSSAFLLSMFLKKGKPEHQKRNENMHLKPWAKQVIFLFLFTIFLSIFIHNYFDIPAMWWMMQWLALLQLLIFVDSKDFKKYDAFKSFKKTEISTLLFFFWIISTIWALDFLWYLKYVVLFYSFFWEFFWSVLIWILSAFLDNIPMMTAVLKSDLDMWKESWLLLTLTIWIWWSLISLWSAAWVWVMTKIKWYTFLAHLKFLPIIIVGYLVSIIIFYLQFTYLM